ncbi:hypothetical protein BGZ61DRAFT_593271 [Ilyonectria robusta]|uniref:uncharacterized protein n=1 Tax=Ilyonectria robusta TaxID=1079257 RepID=UPI001E8DFCBE|nr:uncharacterized protein BGZ61DRAFT_593271 [Ilyonectria robusta]KAH8664958.1 hypothetical protein BGZ61DRAFT_593271 [Ilyonectria robusta]
MQFSYLLAMLPMALAAAVAPTEASKGIVFVGPYSINATADEAAEIVKRDGCGSARDLIDRGDIEFLKNGLQNDDPWSVIAVPRLKGIGWYYGTAMVCVRNPYVFVDTYVSRWEAGWAIDYISKMCCSNSGTSSGCQGGDCLASGTDGLTLRVWLQTPQDSCLS